MEYITTKKEMQDIDRYTIEQIGIPAAVLMERAALEIVALVERLNPERERVLVVAEGGNNGGDALAAARILLERGYKVDVSYLEGLPKSSALFHMQLTLLQRLGVHIDHGVPGREYKVIVDGIFGIGLSRAIEGAQKRAIETLNRMSGIKVAIDIPSGIDATTGKILGTAFRADYTITFGMKKLGMFFFDGPSYSGKVICRNIGFPEEAVQHVSPKAAAYDRSDLRRLPLRYINSNKGSYGKVAVIAGSKNMSGAAFLCAKAAYTTGAGLVKIYTHESNRVILQSQLPEAIMKTYDDYEGALACIEDAMLWASVIVVGPGLGVDTTSERMLYELLMNAEIPLVVDADALNILSDNMELMNTSAVRMVITPHMKEMSRLLKRTIPEIQEDRFEIARKFARKMAVTLVLKDARTIVTDGGDEVIVNLGGNNGMSTGGSGDVLSGIIAGMIAQGLSLADASRIGTYVHCLAGDKAAEEKGSYALLASDIISCIGEVLKAVR